MVVLNYVRFNCDGSPICHFEMDLMAISAALKGIFSIVADMDGQRLSMDHKCQLQCIGAWKRGLLKKHFLINIKKVFLIVPY